MNRSKILAELEINNPEFFENYELMARRYYSVYTEMGDAFSIPKSHAAAMLALLEANGYDVVKKATPTSGGDNVVYLRKGV